MHIPPFIFFGTPDVASETLEILFTHKILPALIITAPDRPSGRGMHLTPSPVKVWAVSHNIPVLTPEQIDSIFLSRLQSEIFILAIVVAYGKILPRDLIESFPLGVLNIHYSLLPKYRGASPVESALLHGDTETGVAIQKMVHELDAGDIVAMEKVDILPTDTTTTLRTRMIHIGALLLIRILPEYVRGAHVSIAQDHSQASRCGKIKKQDGDLTHETSDRVKWNKYRAYNQWPRTYFFRNNKRIVISKATFENDTFTIKKIIPEGKKETDYSTFNQ
ncbi:MAG: methionyl-tRNA formyltransferase [Candidatus Pacebacteria bacterium]|nr:methionyl-tRNA formyltransferase [Candidatus Paceibacterota bacterium]